MPSRPPSWWAGDLITSESRAASVNGTAGDPGDGSSGTKAEVAGEKVILAVNGGPESDAALCWAIERAKRHRVELDVLTVVPLGPNRPAGSDRHVLPAYERVLTEAVERAVREAPGTTVTGFVRRGDVRRELLAASARADLLVMGAHEPRGIFHGILPHQVAAATRGCVVVVPAGWMPRAGPVLVGADDDETSRIALQRAADEAEQTVRPLEIVHVWRMAAAMLPGVNGVSADPSASVKVAHEQILQGCATAVRRSHPGLEVRTRLREGPAALELVELAASADLLVVGTHRHGTVPGLLLGSVAHDVLINLPCPVLVVPHPDEEPLHRRLAAREFAPDESESDLY
jgi:nucleotide-binding universal stress UspA family protein